MAKQSVQPVRKFHFGWRGLTVFLLTFAGIFTLSNFFVVHWIERQLLTTDNWVKMVEPLPKNSEVASALSSYSVNNVFASADIEAKISQALPPKISFVASVLSQQLQARVTNRTKNLIMSDQFQTVWIAVNRAAHERLMNYTRGNSTQGSSGKLASFNINISSLQNSIRSFVGSNSNQLPALPSSESGVPLAVSLKTKLSNFRAFVKTADFLDSVLGLFALAFLLGAFIVSYKRRRLLLIVTGVLVVLALVELTSIKAFRQVVLDEVQNGSYRPAVGIIYDQALTLYRHSVIVVASLSALLFIIALITQPKILNTSKAITKQLASLKQSTFGKWVIDLRKTIRRYRFYVMGAIVLIGLFLSAFVLNLDWQGLTRSALFVVIAVECVSLAGTRPRRARMEQ